jgi:hypothetical protein
MRSLFVTRHGSGDQVKKDKMGGAGDRREGEENCIWNFWEGNKRGRDNLG